MSTENGEHSGRPKEVVTDENIKKIHKIILNDRKFKFNEIADTLNISTERVHNIIHDYLGMRKLKQSGCASSLLTKNNDELMIRSMYETWLHHFTPSNRQSSEWTARNEPAPKCGKTQQSAGKSMASILWDTHRIIFIEYLVKGRTMNSDYYIALFDRSKAEIAEKRPYLMKKKVLLHQDNASCHKSVKMMAKIHELGFELVPHPPYSPDLAPSDYYLLL
ncbi:hypothetical protein GWI33_002602 [Rhynchophorus ferrugineus]|uniref:Transposase n=1 Tax=Rhynchophorus ferrugineus TaxID=354439 RepID=A0A834IME2_RHYFE|nr:hypothetical protein GWI33_002602 [Rhynchophorus ferrugineus]